jgi:glyoxylase-like metal-dependent hydrolase (beta-lactamase superfamily II)
VVCVSGIWQTTCTVVHSGDETFVIDSPVLPEELEALPSVLQQAGWELTGLLATHGDWDHVLGRYAFADPPLGVAETTANVLRSGSAQRALRDFDEEWYVERPGPLALGTPQELPVPGHCGLGSAELELLPTGGHTADGMAISVPWAGVLVVGDHLSPVEIPMISPGGSVAAYLDTLARLEPFVERATHVVPGHGEPLDAERALAILREDRAYLEALRSDGGAAPLPLARRTAAQAKIHERNVSAPG